MTGKMSKNLDIAVLLDCYGAMLTDKQRDAIELYYNQDLSLGEIAEHEQITRQGVRDAIKRGEAFLLELEEKLKLLENYHDTMSMLQRIRQSAEQIKQENNVYHSRIIEENLDQICSSIDSYILKNS